MPGVTDKRWSQLLARVCCERLVVPAFQPIVDSMRGVVCGYEGLARFSLPEVASPQEYFAAAALHGFSGPVEATAVAAMLEHRGDLPANCFLSINLSPDALRAPEVQRVFEAAGDLSGVVIEITEQTPVEDYDSLSDLLDMLRRRGALVAVDDTGAGYASLSHILALRPSFVKLDRQLVTGVDRDPRRASAVAAIGAFAGELDAWLVAEGVERAAELQRLVELGVPLVQGYLLGRPEHRMADVPASVAAALRAPQAPQADDRLAKLVRPAPVARYTPDILGEPMIVADERGRPLTVLAPHPPSGRPTHHGVMSVQRNEAVADVALRAAARSDEDRYAPICLCDELGRAVGLIAVDALLDCLAREARGVSGTAGGRG